MTLTLTHSAFKPPAQGPRIAWTYYKRVANQNYGRGFLFYYILCATPNWCIFWSCLPLMSLNLKLNRHFCLLSIHSIIPIQFCGKLGKQLAWSGTWDQQHIRSSTVELTSRIRTDEFIPPILYIVSYLKRIQCTLNQSNCKCNQTNYSNQTLLL